jgi:5-methylcytosine-specific restriction enzyme subunit McrC
MKSNQLLESVQVGTFELTEWDQTGPARDARLNGLSLVGQPKIRQLAEMLRGRLDFRQGYDGLEIASTSFVGRVDVGSLRVIIRPKLPALPLTRLLRYAYGLRDLTTFEETRAPTARHGLQDLLVVLLTAEVDELLRRGLARRYMPQSESLESPRGQILVDKIILRGGIREARLPCRHFKRRSDWHLNRVLRSGLETAAPMTEDRDLRRRVYQLAAMFGDVEPPSRLRIEDIDLAERELTRLTDVCRPALTIIRLLQGSLGLDVDSSEQSNRTPGFLFDMNVFFQRLLSRFLRDNLANSRVVDELAIRDLFAYAPNANPRNRKAPAPRPDYALFRDNKLSGFLDAKYRDVWERNVPAEWLYQLSIYSLAAPNDVSVLLYASMSDKARDERVEIRQPISWSNKKPASVIFRPVPLFYLAELLDRDQADTLSSKRHQLADRLVRFQTGSAI